MRILEALVVGPSALRLLFSDGLRGEVDLAPSLTAHDPLRDRAFFTKVFTNGLTVEWPGGIDYCPDFLHEWCASGEMPASPKPARFATAGQTQP